MASLLERANFVRQCKEEYRIGLWQCPQFLFVVMGVLTVLAMLATYFIGTSYAEPEVVIFVVMGVTVIIFSLGNTIVSSFEHIAKLNQAKSEFISIVSHQLRSPLSGMKWSVGLLLSGRLGRFEQKPTEYLQVMRESNERMISLVNNLLNVNRIEAGQFNLTIAPFDLKKIAKDVIREFAFLAKASNVEIAFLDDTELPQVLGDQEKIKIVIENLVDNAVKYTSTKGEVRLSLKKGTGVVTCAVADTGVGIPWEQQKRVFEKFFRADNTLKYQTKGSGLGLFIARSIVESLGGRMGFTSEEHRGSTFWFTLPIAK